MSWEFVIGAILVALVALVFLGVVGYNYNDSLKKEYEFKMNCLNKGGTYIGGYSNHCIMGHKQ